MWRTMAAVQGTPRPRRRNLEKGPNLNVTLVPHAEQNIRISPSMDTFRINAFTLSKFCQA